MTTASSVSRARRAETRAPRRVVRTAGSLVGLLLVAAFSAVGLGAAPARADLGSLGDLTVGIAASAGFQPDGRGCSVGKQDRTFPGTNTCILFAGGVDASFLWRGRIGASLGVWSVAGQAAVAEKPTDDAPEPAAFPDRVSVPLMLDVRPLAFLVAPEDRSYRARALHGVRLALGPSFELVRTSLDSSLDWGARIGSPARAVLGLHASFDGEIPLHAAADVRSGLSLRLSVRLLYVPIVTLAVPSGGLVSSQPIELPSGETGVADRFHGLGVRAQLFLGLVYYL